MGEGGYTLPAHHIINVSINRNRSNNRKTRGCIINVSISTKGVGKKAVVAVVFVLVAVVVVVVVVVVVDVVVAVVVVVVDVAEVVVMGR